MLARKLIVALTTAAFLTILPASPLLARTAAPTDTDQVLVKKAKKKAPRKTVKKAAKERGTMATTAATSGKKTTKKK